ncbi:MULTISPECIES: hypothetical protein [unclassified Streptomyces]|uniref:hypothetical protein n=1 Tax=unclassified Streptomyces TaxID=2593676 RepID=UPI000DC7CBA5|nr:MULTISPECIES: hypothetical protein [unclassified Streptomyces]AWZ04231.1 hypothetical protein DRB89_05855 [Streptomyces sp. ICC4]AWZ11841.1 hypothetical protein DRB96_05390 [Streptomyces sp. ICC1]
MPDSVFPAGPVFGPDSLVIDIDDGGPADSAVGVRIRPDAHNTGLAAAGEPTRYYFEPPRMTVATRSGSTDLDFSATVMLKAPVGPHPEYIGGSCTFSCTAALPDGAAARIVEKLADHDHPDPPARIAPLFAHRDGGPAPELLMVPITANTVSCVVEHPPTGPGPLLMSVQGGAGGGIDIQARSSFLVSFSPAAAEAVVTNLRDAAAPPFLVRNVLTEQFDTGQAIVHTDVDIDIEKLHEVFAAAVPPGESWPGGDAAGAAYRAAVAVGAVRTHVTETRPAGTVLVDPSVGAWLSDTDELRKAVFRMARESLFDVTAATAPQAGQDEPPAPGWWAEVFGDARVTLKSDPPTGSVHLQESLITHGTVTVEHTIEGGLAEVAAAARTQLDKYLTVIAI